MPLPLDLLRSLSEAVAVSGDEGAVRKLILEAIRPHVASVKVDHLGNLLAVKKATRPDAARVMLAAHMDEVGLMITDHDSDGQLRFVTVGGVDEDTLPGQPVWIGAKRLAGVIGAAPIHLVPRDRRLSTISVNHMRIDLGAASKSEAQKQVTIGDRGTFATEFLEANGIMRGKALDNRIGCATLIELLRGPAFGFELHAAFTVQEEVGLRGAQVAAFGIDPQCGIALDCTPAHDLPDYQGRENTRYNARLGHGPALYVADRRMISDARLVQFFEGVAQRANIPYQIRQPGGGGTDAGAIQRARGGVPALSISVPARYLHSPAALARLSDWADTLRLLQTALEQWTPAILA